VWKHILTSERKQRKKSYNIVERLWMVGEITSIFCYFLLAAEFAISFK